MGFSTLLDLTRQAKIGLGETASFDGSLVIGENFFIGSTKIDLTDASSGQLLKYNGITDTFEPENETNTSVSNTRVISGLLVSQNTGNTLTFDVSSGVFSVSGTLYSYTGGSVTISSGDSSFDRYDLIYIDSGNTASVKEGTPALTPIIPTLGDDEVGLGVVFIESGSTTPTLSLLTFFPAKNVSYERGVYNNVADYLDNNYVFPKILSITNDVNELEYGQSGSTINVTWETNKRFYTQSELTTSTSLNKTLRTYTFTGQTITGNSSSTAYTYTLTINDSFNTDVESTDIKFYGRIYYGMFSGTTIVTTGSTDATNEALGLINNEFFRQKQLTIPVNGDGNYFWAGYPAIFGEPVIYINGLLNNDITLFNKVMTNQFNHDENYIFFRTNNIINASGLTITISNSKILPDNVYIGNTGEYRRTKQTFSGNTTFSRLSNGIFKQQQIGSVNTFWSDPLDGDIITIINASGGDITLNGNGKNLNADGISEVTKILNSSDSVTFYYDSDDIEWKLI